MPLKSSLIDTHAHLDNRPFAQDLEDVIARARDNDVDTILTVGCDLESSRHSIALAQRFTEVYAAVGIHPHDALQADEEGLRQLRELAVAAKVVALGETGLDYYRDRAPRDAQRLAFRRQIRLARELALPLIVHDRDAHEDILTILREEQAAEVGGVIHCFSGDLAMARACLEMGFYISFPATITYPKNSELREVVRSVPMERLLIETDCPYLAPQPFRGKRNEPAYVRLTAEKVAEIKGLSLEDVARITTLNAGNLFGIGRAEQAVRIAYAIRNSLYLNITNRCTNACSFCAKFHDFTVKGHRLKLEHEPDAAEVIAAMGDPTAYDEVVFCGYGEPLLRLDLIKEVAAWLKEKGCRVRINTDGQANLVHGRNIVPELAGLVDSLSVSLNAPDATTYQNLCHSQFGEQAFEGVKEFIRAAADVIPEVVASAVTVPGLDIAACRRLAEELGAEFREREYNEVG
ncbi:TatD family hydrolase [Geoalkalibacter halelectricus]|uniref:YchF/TatD family DNA exonuclease n=1 Tax=Geoalkalibacter halelectricus TaxID=2847045 RepID=A0ABY5ZMW7_9BACT|nr:TatD family hydrolase [Geoalkalibacter halelectricus]MDO3380060.1 YchF/TatD family DNA exonuclease [Geoalkalibacter halelectricus]UWZ80418.1 YchF/TatD family DNA exonuclease [Geoalkalibacter halelectricus]